LNINAQNWQSVPANDTNWFVINNTPYNQSGRLRVAWLDSSISSGSITTNYFYLSLRMNSIGCLDTLGASWLGKKYTRNQITGEEQYYNLFNDTIILKTKSGLNDTWIVVSDTSGIDIVATVISEGVLAIDGMMDSIKSIQLQAFQLGNPITHDYNTQLILSKNHGFVRALEWYSFPYSLNLNYQFVESFTIGHNRLDKIKTMISLNESKSKYTPGNEWITELSLNPFPSSSLTTYRYDSIISLIDTSIGYRIIFQRKRKVNDFQNSTQTIYDSILTELKDTTIVLTNHLVTILPEYIDYEFGYHPNFITDLNSVSIYHNYITYGCNQQLKLEKKFMDSYSIHHESNGCIQFATTMVFPIYKEHIDVVLEEDFGLQYQFQTDNFAQMSEFEYTYYNINGCMSGAKYNILLPADAFDLQATLHNQHQVHVNWQTSNEHNVSHFVLERSIDGIHFFTIKQIVSQGNNSNSNLYTLYDDVSNLKSTLYYRVKMVDIDGQINYSNTAFVHLNSLEKQQVFPTLFSTKITVAGLKKENAYTIQLKDIYGRIVYNSMQESTNLGQVVLTQIDHLAKGNYILICLYEDGIVIREKVTKVE
jgi:hypothetical protein